MCDGCEPTTATIDISSFAYIRHQPVSYGGLYEAFDNSTHQRIGYLNYMLPLDGEKLIFINGAGTVESYRRRHVAYGIIERMHADYPDYKMTAGPRTDDAHALYEHLESQELRFVQVGTRSTQQGEPIEEVVTCRP